MMPQPRPEKNENIRLLFSLRSFAFFAAYFIFIGGREIPGNSSVWLIYLPNSCKIIFLQNIN
jgi:hypothetical protein